MNAPDDPSSDDRTELLGHDQDAPADGGDFGPGSRIGPYTLVEHLGEGGMGQVFLAEQVEPIRRRVALKLIRRQIADDLTLAYFQIERQALARMEHPAIARVYDAGRTTEGFPYFAMEYVDGITLRRWRREASPDLAARLRLFATLVRGVQHAHERGIVHRDLKPDNILVTVVDGQAQPKLIDFGIAIGVDGSGSVSAHRAGTVDYMSPEQFAEQHAAIDARSDVYSLGAVLLDLLDEAQALRGSSTTLRPTELHARLLASLKGRSHDLRALPIELRHLLARALAPDREQRYTSAAALADDVQRFLDGEPLAAVPPTRRYVARKFVQRHRVPVALASAIALAVVAGLVATTWSLQRAERETARARATADFLSNVLAGVDPDVARDLDKTLLRKVLDEAASRAERDLRDQPDVLADIEAVILRSYAGLGDAKRALEHATSIRERAIARHGAGSDEALAALPGYADALRNTSRSAEAIDLLPPAIAEVEQRHGPDSRLALRLHYDYANLLRDTGRQAEALEQARRSADGARATLGDDDDLTLRARMAVAIGLADADRFDEAIAEITAVIERRTALSGADDPLVLTTRNSLAVFYMQARRFADGERELTSLVDAYERVHGPEGTYTLMLHGNLGGALRQQGKIEASGPHYRRAMEGFRKLFGTDHMRSITTLHNYANWLLESGDANGAVQEQEAALAAIGRVSPGDSPTTAEILTGLGKARLGAGDLTGAERALLESVRMKIATRGPDNSRLPASREALRELYTKLGRDDEVARYAEPVAKTP